MSIASKYRNALLSSVSYRTVAKMLLKDSIKSAEHMRSFRRRIIPFARMDGIKAACEQARRD